MQLWKMMKAITSNDQLKGNVTGTASDYVQLTIDHENYHIHFQLQFNSLLRRMNDFPL